MDDVMVSSSDSTPRGPTSPGPPDGGWGWWVVVGAFIINLLTAGSSWAYGVLYVALLDALGGTKAETALVGSLVYMVLVFMAPYASAACRRYGHRLVIMFGGGIASVAIIGSSFTTSINQLYYTYGVLTGFGYGCCLVPSFLIVQQYFKKRMGIAMGIAMSGGGIGMFIMALSTQQLLTFYDWRGSLLILGAINANLCLAGALMRPVNHMYKTRRYRQKSLGYIDIKTTSHEDGKTIPIVKRLRRKYSLSVVATYLKPADDNKNQSSEICDAPVVNEGTFDLRDDVIMEEDEESSFDQNKPALSESDIQTTTHEEMSETIHTKDKNSGCCRYQRRVYSFFDAIYNFTLFKDPIYDCFQLSVLVGFTGMSICTTHVVKRALDYGISTQLAASLVYGFGIGQALGRGLGGVIVDHVPFNKIAMCFLTLLFAGISTEASIYFTTYIGQQISCLMVGFFFGAVATISMGVLVDVFGAKLLSYTISMSYLIGGFGTILGSTMAGKMRDKYGSYDGAFHLSAAADIACAFFNLLLIPLISWRRRRQTRHKPINEEHTGQEKPATTSC